MHQHCWLLCTSYVITHTGKSMRRIRI